ncbi:prenyltransferase [Geomicrobium sp. JCM 19039]|uniref:prenyltransferase n=1 Tax=Geomicrobium sp. JCM 19039 TaxID=1460636 RepID=UPI00045F2A0B|nr:prenyltransferase [Geomicrobium sp. JCM 19039]GAK11910.1 1,4-dihydroxy-2-naphthoate octaprenyltransferase [Geomicrobium sp. JCM 19039]
MHTSVKFWMKTTRSQVLPVMVLPVLIGAAGAFAVYETFHLGLFLLTLIGALSAHLFSNMINDLWDFRNGVDIAAEETAAAISTNSRVLPSGTVPERTFAFVTWLFFFIALLCGVVISAFVGWTVLLFAAAGGAIAYFYVAPPLKFGYRGKGYSEVAIFLAFGVLPVVGTYYVLTEQLDLQAFMMSVPIGILTTLILFNHHFLHWQADEASGKKTLVVVLGEKGALRFSKVLASLGFFSIIVGIVFGAFPWYTVLAIIPAIPLFKVYPSFNDTNANESYVKLMSASLKASVRSGLIITICLIISGLL